MLDFFHTTFYEPLYNALIFLYSFLGSDLGLAIIALTVIIKVALFGMSKKQISSQKEMMDLQPKIKKLQLKYKENKEKLAQETMALYKEHGVNPAAGCLPLIIQLIVFITLYRVIINLAQRDEFRVITEDLYSFVPSVDQINNVFLPAFLNMDLAVPNYILAVFTAAAQYYQIKMMQARQNEMKSAEDLKAEEEKKKASKEKNTPPDMSDIGMIMQKQMLVIIPVMTLVIGFTFPAGLTLYWFSSTLFMIGQQYLVMKQSKEEKGESTDTKEIA